MSEQTYRVAPKGFTPQQGSGPWRCVTDSPPHTQMLLAVPMKGLRARPAFAIDVQYPPDLPIHPVGHQALDRLLAVFAIPQNHQANGMIDVGKTHGLGEIPLLAIRRCRPVSDLDGRNGGGASPLRRIPKLDPAGLRPRSYSCAVG